MKMQKLKSAVRKIPHMARITVFSCFVSLLVMEGFKEICGMFDRISPMSNKIPDFELSDLCFRLINKGEHEPNIVIVDCSKDSRDELAEKISSIERYAPLVIGLDVVFKKKLPYEENKKLLKVLDSNRQNIVIGYSELTHFDHQLLGGNDYHFGFTDPMDDNLTRRYFYPYRSNYNGLVDTAFAVKIALLAHHADTTLKTYANSVTDKKQLINFRNGLQGRRRYKIVYDLEDTAAFRDKIVLIGGIDTTCPEDIHFSPLNDRISRVHEDMFGVEFHAQTLSMIIHNDYIKELSMTGKALILFCSSFLLIAVSKTIDKSKHLKGYGNLMMSIVIMLLTFLFLGLSALFMHFKIKFEPLDCLPHIFVVLMAYPLYDNFCKCSYGAAKMLVKKYEKRFPV